MKSPGYHFLRDAIVTLSLIAGMAMCLTACGSQRSVTVAANVAEAGKATGSVGEQLGQAAEAPDTPEQMRPVLRSAASILRSAAAQVVTGAQALIERIDWKGAADRTPTVPMAATLERPVEAAKAARQAADELGKQTSGIQAAAGAAEGLATQALGYLGLGGVALGLLARLRKWRKTAETAIGFGRQASVIAARYAPGLLEEVKGQWSKVQARHGVLKLVTPILDEIKAKEPVTQADLPAA